MSDEKPLHVRVAEALGWTNCHLVNERWWGRTPVVSDIRGVPRYDLLWSETGPFLEKYCFELANLNEFRGVGWQAKGWERATGGRPQYIGRGETPLIAVCNLLLKLHEAGKL